MSNKEEFKLFVKSHPELIRYVKDGEMTWQKFYETYSLYGKENDVWNKYFNNNEEIKENTNEKKENVSITDVIDMVKKVDLNIIYHHNKWLFLFFISSFKIDNIF